MAPDVWVQQYTTSSGVHVAGHWRRRTTAVGDPEDQDEGGGAPPLRLDNIESTGPGQQTAVAAHGASSGGAVVHSPPAPPGKAGIQGYRGRLEAAQGRYDAAVVAAGLSALRHRGDGNSPRLRASLRERAEARAELAAARAEVDATGATQGNDQCPHCGQFQSTGHQCPTPAGLPDTDYAELKGDARVRAMVGDLEASVKAVVESGQLNRWLDAMASNGLNRWSANNRLLAITQVLQRGGSLEGLHMMGFRQWEKHDRHVSKGAKAVYILAPITRKVVDEDSDGTTRERHRVVGFKSVPVFNISDTHGEPLPSAPVRPAEGEATPGTLSGLRDRVGQVGYSYEETEIPGCNPATGEGTLGYTQPDTKRIVVDSRLSEAQKASTIAHELGHVHCGHVDGDYSEYQRHRGRMETEAEMTAYLVNRSRGMSRDQAEAFSPGYIATWSKGDPSAMHGAVDKATRAFNKITEGDWPPEGEK